MASYYVEDREKKNNATVSLPAAPITTTRETLPHIKCGKLTRDTLRHHPLAGQLWDLIRYSQEPSLGATTGHLTVYSPSSTVASEASTCVGSIDVCSVPFAPPVTFDDMGVPRNSKTNWIPVRRDLPPAMSVLFFGVDLNKNEVQGYQWRTLFAGIAEYRLCYLLDVVPLMRGQNAKRKKKEQYTIQ